MAMFVLEKGSFELFLRSVGSDTVRYGMKVCHGEMVFQQVVSCKYTSHSSYIRHLAVISVAFTKVLQFNSRTSTERRVIFTMKPLLVGTAKAHRNFMFRSGQHDGGCSRRKQNLNASPFFKHQLWESKGRPFRYTPIQYCGKDAQLRSDTFRLISCVFPHTLLIVDHEQRHDPLAKQCSLTFPIHQRIGNVDEKQSLPKTSCDVLGWCLVIVSWL